MRVCLKWATLSKSSNNNVLKSWAVQFIISFPNISLPYSWCTPHFLDTPKH